MAVIKLRFHRRERKQSVTKESGYSIEWHWALMNRSYTLLAEWYERGLCGGYVYDNVLEFFVVDDTPYGAPALLIKIRRPRDAQEWEYTQLNIREMGILLMRNINDSPEEDVDGESEGT